MNQALRLAVILNHASRRNDLAVEIVDIAEHRLPVLGEPPDYNPSVRNERTAR
ncbi:hypothetical protein O7602_27910 [Micromonospora sp. WMMD1128]|uniref:hypothetical protein n=1 Tax=Micromonospora sp. WMMD1128 TaxID=3015150 RepID=UPI00248D2A8E|nr:hypothetical protein [Micromonospora sp. WMMD1128]WBB73457.1 hypothetical protein O7602_27910 [Micromonospora sp. WMMD1128]